MTMTAPAVPDKCIDCTWYDGSLDCDWLHHRFARAGGGYRRSLFLLAKTMRSRILGLLGGCGPSARLFKAKGGDERGDQEKGQGPGLLSRDRLHNGSDVAVGLRGSTANAKETGRGP